MNDHNDKLDLSPELRAIDDRLSALGSADRNAAPAGLEARIISATAGTLSQRSTQTEPRGVLAKLSVRRLDWPMRVAAVIAVMIGGWAVIHGTNTPAPQTDVRPKTASFNPDEVFDFVFGRSGTTEQIQRLLQDTQNLEKLVGGDDTGDPEPGDQENL